MANVNLVEDIEKSRFMLILLEEEKYLNKICELINSLKPSEKICYLCLIRPYEDIFNEFKSKNIDTKKFYFIDVLSSHYGKRKPLDNCTFLDSPTDLGAIKKAIFDAFKNKQCGTVIFDTASTLLIYHETSKIVRFTHDFLSEETEKNKVLYLILKHDSVPSEENQRLVDDLVMFADKTLRVNKNIALANSKTVL